MEILEDKDNRLIWHTPKASVMTSLEDGKIMLDDMRIVEEYKNILNGKEWNNENIRRFITGKNLLLGNLFYSRSNHPYSNVHYAHDNGACVGAVVIKKDIIKVSYQDINDYVVYCSDNNISRLDGYMLLDDAIRALNQSELDNYSIDYIAVSGAMQGKGVGDRMLSSILNNSAYFMKYNNFNLVSALINDDNNRSIHLFNHHDFYPVYSEGSERFRINHKRFYYVNDMEAEKC